MQMRTLGRTGIKVSPYCLGTMMLGAWGNPDHAEGVAMVHRALDAGINFVDTADTYSDGESETILGAALAGRRDDVVVSTKAHFPMGTDPNRAGNSRRWLTRAVEDSLRRLDTDWIDVLQVHRPDPDTDIDETLSTLSDLVHAGKVRVVGTSTFPAEQIVHAQWVADARGHVRPRVEQAPYSILNRAVEAAVLPTCQQFGMGVTAWSPLSSGWLTGRYRSAGDVDLASGRRAIQAHKFDPDSAGNRAKLDAVTALADLADELDVSMTHLAIAFVLAHPGVTAAILGPRTGNQLDDLLAGADVTLDDATLDRIDEIATPGVTLNPTDSDYTPPALADRAQRRRPAAERTAQEAA